MLITATNAGAAGDPGRRGWMLGLGGGWGIGAGNDSGIGGGAALSGRASYAVQPWLAFGLEANRWGAEGLSASVVAPTMSLYPGGRAFFLRLGAGLGIQSTRYSDDYVGPGGTVAWGSISRVRGSRSARRCICPSSPDRTSRRCPICLSGEIQVTLRARPGE